MKIKSALAVGAMGVGLGLAGFIGGAGTASAEDCGEVPIGITPGNIICNVESNLESFGTSISPQYNANVLLYGTVEDGKRSGLGLLDQPQTFASSLQRFASGPIAPDGPPEAATGATPPP